jgi:hypothetical protein
MAPTPFVAQLGDEPAHVAFVERLHDCAVGRDALGHVEAQMTRDERFGKLKVQIVEIETMLAADLHRVAEPRRGQ